MIVAREIIEKNQLPDKDNGLYCLIGQAQDGSVHFCDILKAPHMLVGGRSGSGKSVFLRGVILSLMMNYTPDEVGLVLLDPKHHTEFIVYDEAPHVLGTELVCAERELERRLALRDTCKKQKPIVVIIDEYAEFFYDKQSREVVEKLVQRGYGMGIYVILATQRLAKDVLTPVLKENLSTVVMCAVGDKKTSKFVLGQYGAEKLYGSGEILYKDGGGNIVRLQVGYADNQSVQDIVQALKGK